MNSLDVRHCKNNIEVIEVIEKWLFPGDLLLIKGSRANKMEEIANGIEEYYNTLEKLIV
jgi:UDP-N-acetylmuramyl pentapeptide synthase